MSNLSAFPYITERAPATPALWNDVYSILSANLAAVAGGPFTSASTQTLSFSTNIEVIGGGHFQQLSIGSTPPSVVTTAAVTIAVNSAFSDYLYLTDSSGARSNYVIGSRAGGTADGLNIWDASGATMIVSFSKQSVRFFQQVTGPVFDVGGALASTLNAATFGTGADSKESRIQAAISAASIAGIARVYVPANMYPYSSGSVSFSSMVQMVREGGDWTRNDLIAFGATANGVADDTNAIISAKSWAIQRLPETLYFSKGTYKYSGASIGNMAYAGFTLLGDGFFQTVLKNISAGTAYAADAFQPGFTGNDATAPFITQCNMKDITIEGNSTTTTILFLQGIARSAWDVNVREARATDGVAYDIRGCSINDFAFRCSSDIQTMTNVPSEGLRISVGTRNGLNVGSSTNNRLHAIIDGPSIGGRWSGADQTVSVAGAYQDARIHGLILGAGARFNVFLGTAFESKSTASDDITDAGMGNVYNGIYAKVNLLLQGQGAIVHGGFFERIELQSVATRNYILSPIVKHWTATGGGVGAGGFFDSGVETVYQNIWDESAGTFLASYYGDSRATMRAHRFLAGAGTAGTPSYAFSSETSLGWYRSQASAMALSYGTLTVPDGTSDTPSYTFTSGTTVGIYRRSVGDMDFAHAGSVIARVTNLQFGVRDGTALRPGIYHFSDNSLGWFSSGAATIALSYGTFNLNQGKLVSLRTVGASLDSTNMAKGEAAFTIIGSGASLAIQSGSTIFYFLSSTSTKAP